MIATLNRWIGVGLLVIGTAIALTGVVLGFFAWINDGATAGLRLVGVTTAFGSALAAGGGAFLWAAGAHARRHPRRWWTQAIAVVLAYVAFGLAAELTSLLDRTTRS